VFLGVFLPPRALVVHRVLQTIPVFVIGGGPARVRLPRAPVLLQVLKNGQVSILGCVVARGVAPRAPVLVQVLESGQVPTFGCGRARGLVPRAPVLVQVLESGQVPIKNCVVARVRTPIKVVLSRPLQQSYTPPASSVVAYGPRSFTKKSNDSLVGQRQSFVVVQKAYDERTPRPRRHARERVEVEPERVRRGRLGGVPPQLADQAEVTAGLDAPHVGEHHGRDVHAGIKDRLLRIGCRHVARGRNGDVARVRVNESWLSVVAFLGEAF